MNNDQRPWMDRYDRLLLIALCALAVIIVLMFLNT